MKLRAWLVFPFAALLCGASFVAANAVLLHQLTRNAPARDAYVTTIDLPLWWYVMVFGPPLVPIGAYVWQRLQTSDSG